MTPLLVLLIGGLVGALVFAAERDHRRRVEKAWQEAGRMLGLEFTTTTEFLRRRPVLTGELDGAQVKVDTFTRSTGKSSVTYTRIVVRGPGIPISLGLRKEGFLMSLKKVFAGEDVPTADLAFDGQVYVAGRVLEAMAVLDEPTRREVVEFLGISKAHDVHIRAGAVYFDQIGRIADPRRLGELIRRLTGLAGRLALASPVVDQRLAANLAAEPLPAVRLRLLTLLLSNYRASPAAARAARAALGDPDPELRLKAAAAGILPVAEATPVLRALTRSQAVPERLRAAALEELAAGDPDPENQELLEEALEFGPLKVRLAALKGLVRQGRLGRRPELDVLLKLARSAHPELAPAAIEAVAESGDPAAEGAIAGLLDRTEVPIQRAAAQALGKIGSVASVPRLHELAADMLGDGELKRRAREAIAAIQSRIEGGGAGQLSLAEPSAEAGRLSLATGGGTLALAPEDGEIGAEERLERLPDPPPAPRLEPQG